MTTANDLDRRVVIERYTETRNTLNEPVKVWAKFAEVFANRKDVSDGEKLAAGQLGSSIVARFIIRSSTAARTVSPLDRIIHDGKTWEITGVKQADLGRNRFVEIKATARNEP